MAAWKTGHILSGFPNGHERSRKCAVPSLPPEIPFRGRDGNNYMDSFFLVMSSTAAVVINSPPTM